LKRDELRRQLEAFHQDRNAAEYESWGRPHLDPPPRLDAEYADLFRPEAVAGMQAAFADDPYRLSRWSLFIEAGRRRRRQAAERQHLEGLFWRSVAGTAKAIPGSLVDALTDVAADSDAPRHHERHIPHSIDLILSRRALLEGWRHEGESATVLSAQVFGAEGCRDLWSLLTDAGGYLRRGDGEVTLSRGQETGTLARRLPGQVWLLHGPEAGMAAWDLFMQAAGEAMAQAHLPGSVPPEDLWLPGDGGPAIYGRLWARRLLQASWYAAAGVVGERAESLARLARSRLAVRLLDLAAATGEGQAAPMPLAGRRWLLGWPQEAALAMGRLCPGPEAAECLHQEQMAALLDHVLLRRFGYDWDRSPRAADLLRQLWSEGWARPVHELISFLGETDLEGEALLEDFD
jgi:hypothetical protein